MGFENNMPWLVSTSLDLHSAWARRSFFLGSASPQTLVGSCSQQTGFGMVFGGLHSLFCHQQGISCSCCRWPKAGTAPLAPSWQHPGSRGGASVSHWAQINLTEGLAVSLSFSLPWHWWAIPSLSYCEWPRNSCTKSFKFRGDMGTSAC